VDLFQRGEKSGKKVSPETAAKAMRSANFSKEDFLSVKQVTAYFSKLARENKQLGVASSMQPIADESDQSDDDDYQWTMTLAAIREEQTIAKQLIASSKESETEFSD
jgi:hypothetical protein